MEFDKVKVVVLGDSGVGKSGFVHLLCYQQPLLNPAYTIGCNLEVKVHQYRADYSCDKPFFVEFWDVGGCKAHANTRSVFYQGAHGLMLIYDCTNHKSQLNLRKWLPEFLYKSPVGSVESVNQVNTGGVGRVANILSYWSQNDPLTGVRFLSSEKQNESFNRPVDSSGRAIPVLVVGTKVDLLGLTAKKQVTKRWDVLDRLPLRSQLEPENCSLTLRQFTSGSLTRQPESSSVFVDLSWTDVISSASERSKKSDDRTSSSFASELGFPEIFVDSHSASSLAANSWNAMLLDKFLDDVVWTKLSTTLGFGNHSPDSLKFRKCPTEFAHNPSFPSNITNLPELINEC